MRGQVARHQRKNAVVLGEAKKFVPVLVVRRSLFALPKDRMDSAFDAPDLRRTGVRRGACAQQIKRAASVERKARRSRN